MITSLSIVGAGNCGCAFAADLESRGIRVLLYAHPDHSSNVDAIGRDGFLDSIGVVAGRFYPIVTTSMREALQFSNVVILAVPSYAQDDILSELEKFDVSDHIIIAASGNFFTLVASKRIRARYLLETSASPYGSRVIGGKYREQQHTVSWYGINVFGFKTVMPIGSLPADIDENLRADIGTIFPGTLQWCSNVIEAAFYNFNGVLHPITAVMNAGWIEHTKGDFYFYQEGMTPSVTKMMQAIDNERVAIAREYGARVVSCLKQMNTYYGMNHGSLNEFAKGSTLHSTMKLCPTSMQHRYLAEDLPYVLVPWYELGLKAGKQSPFIRSLILWCSMINSTDYLGVGRNLKALGLADWSLDEILSYINAEEFTPFDVQCMPGNSLDLNRLML
ncbi:putative NAD/NADP octopine/nopaline dehydrogenase [Xylaria bambusicola]|uniref:putative NAD/NADP octopine/nopaline dehydrogenase n=1 Tax=Xylaria bambusicola TaxID=326684 RepID=UPI002007B027|nr:putative NAD/NADP octopine/nopaline dehydrogenase [Xylaria bambusicola]KAI0514886.1 putative NAD/NADP octopine/nopaline dehydrogenase [Xylaria bambusicola]